MGEFFDISPLISSQTAVFPGDVPFERQLSLSFDQGHHLELSSIRTTLHIGAHADAPIHYMAGSNGIESVDLKRYVGRAQVLEVAVPKGERIGVADLRGQRITAPRLLIRTQSFLDPDVWRGDFNSLSPELVDFACQQGVVLIGIDTPSIDPATEKKLLSHEKVAELKMSILEGLCLNEVPVGEYVLMAVPLKIQGADASPVRALLFPLDFKFNA